MLKKRCPGCVKTKKADEFYVSHRAKDGLDSYCKVCRKVVRSKNNKTEKNVLKSRERSRQRGKELKLKVLAHYGMKCKCGFSDVRALSIDHVAGNGVDHRKEVHSTRLYRWLVAQKFPSGFQTLCMNCQWIKRHENGEFGNKISP